jgi:CO/xanthine dehydrogenase FAD-binding subunit
MCCSKASVAFCGRRHTDGRLTDVRLALGAVTPVVVRVPDAEQVLEDRVLDARAIQDAARACRRAVRAIDDIRSTAHYRRQVVGALAAEGLLEILDQMHKLSRKRRRKKR